MMTDREFRHKILPLAKNIYSFALNMTGNPADSADITQEVMMKLWDTRQTLQEIGNPKAWALTVTRNLCIDFLKKQKPVYDEEEVVRNGGYDTDLLQQIEHRDAAEAVLRIIHTLPDNQKEVMILREMEGLEYEEISRITGLGLNNIRVLLSRGRSKVKEILRADYEVNKFEN